MDPDSRFIVIYGHISNVIITIANIYGPNYNPHFFHTVFSHLNFSDSAIIVGGDFNTILNPKLDRSNFGSTHRTWHSSDLIKKYMQDLGLSDCWRSKNPLNKEFSYYSPPHKSYSWIDYFLVNNSIIPQINNPEIHPIIISDHGLLALI